MTSVQRTWRQEGRHRLGAGQTPVPVSNVNIKPGMTENSFWPFPFLLMACSCSCVVIQLSRSPHASHQAWSCTSSWSHSTKLCLVLAMSECYLFWADCNCRMKERMWQQPVRRLCCCHYSTAPHTVRDIQWVLACDRYNNNHTLYDTDSTFGFLTGVCCRVSFLSDKTKLKKKRKEKQSHGSFPFKKQHS